MKLPITAALTLGIAPLVGFAAPVESLAVVKSVSGTVWKSGAGGIPLPISVGATLRKGDLLTTGLDSKLEFAFGATAQAVTLAGNTSVRIDRLTTDTGDVIQGRLNLVRGTLQAKAGTLGKGSKIEVQMPNGAVTALADTSSAEWSAIYDARSGNIYNLATTGRGLDLAGAINTGSDAARTHSVTVKSGERFVMPTLADLPADSQLMAAVSPIPSGFETSSALSSITADVEEISPAPYSTGGRAALAAVRKAKSRK